MTKATGKGRRLTRCSVCRTRPAAMARVPYCFSCWPGGPVTPPPCIKCGSLDYFAAGLCRVCHLWAEPDVDSCRDCLAWGATRTYGWLCRGCVAWRRKWPTVDACVICGDTRHLSEGGVCRLCFKQGSIQRETLLPLASTRWQQLFFADMFYTNGRRVAAARRPAPALRAARLTAETAPGWGIRIYDQPTLIDMRPNLAAHGRPGLRDRADPVAASAFFTIACDVARERHWSEQQLQDAIIGTQIMLGLQVDGRPPVRASEVEVLRQIDLKVWVVHEVLRAAGALIEDRVPTFNKWIAARIAHLPEPMIDELRIWVDVMQNGSQTPPRRAPRAKQTTELHVRWAIPVLTKWAEQGHTSLREISRDDVLAALPPSGNPRSQVGQGLKSIFRVLKGRKVVFTDPIAGINTGEHATRQPLPIDVKLVANLLQSDDPATALIVALIAFHGLRMRHLKNLRLTDVRDGRMTVESRWILLADPVRERLATYLTYRNTTWPDAINGYLFINSRCTRIDRAVGPRWVHLKLGELNVRKIREDRILAEARDSGGDVRRLVDLFGLSIHASLRYISTLESEDLTPSS